MEYDNKLKFGNLAQNYQSKQTNKIIEARFGKSQKPSFGKNTFGKNTWLLKLKEFIKWMARKKEKKY